MARTGMASGKCRRRPRSNVPAIRHTREVAAPLPQNPVEPEPEFGRLDLLGVAWADRRNHPRIVDGAFHEADLTPIFQAIGRELLPAQVETRQPVSGKQTLVRE